MIAEGFRFAVVLAAACCLIVASSASAADAPNAEDWLTRETLTGDWGGTRTSLKERGITLRPRLTQFYQGLSSGEGKKGYEYGAKADLFVAADLGKLGFWDGFSMTLHADYNFGRTVNGLGGVLYPVNAALYVPGIDGADAFDFSSVYFGQKFGDAVAVLFGKINMIETVAGKPFMGGAGIDSFWNQNFVATPTGTVPPYLLGALTSVFTKQATYRLWVYDPESKVNKSGLDDAFDSGVSIRGSVEFPVRIGGLVGHQGFTAYYSTQKGVDLASLDDSFLASPGRGTVAVKNSRHYFAWTFDQVLHQAPGNREEGFGLFGQIGMSDGNPNGLRWTVLVGVGGRGLVPGRGRDNWGIGYLFDGFSRDLKDALAPRVTLRDEQGLELFYNFAMTPWFTLGADLQVIKPGLASTTAVVPGLRAVIRF